MKNQIIIIIGSRRGTDIQPQLLQYFIRNNLVSNKIYKESKEIGKYDPYIIKMQAMETASKRDQMSYKKTSK